MTLTHRDKTVFFSGAFSIKMELEVNQVEF